MDELSALATRYASDKVMHGFTPFYHAHLRGRRGKFRKVLEIGVFQGASLLMWRDYFPRAQVHGLDLRDPGLLSSERVHVHLGDQSERAVLDRLVGNIGSGFDLVVDDGGHTMAQQQVSLGQLFPHVRPGGFYVVEDLHTSYMEAIGLYRDGKAVGSYPTGVEVGVPTTFDVIAGLAAGDTIAAPFMTDEEYTYVRQHTSRVTLFDRDGDRQHITSIIEKKRAPSSRRRRRSR